jgi:hypothetical protein
LQYQFSDLKVDKEKMGVTLSFNNIPERLEIPIGAISIFADPSVNFALQFQPIEDKATDDDLALLDELDGDDPQDDGSGGGGKAGGKSDKSKTTGEVVSLDKFRKK